MAKYIAIAIDNLSYTEIIHNSKTGKMISSCCSVVTVLFPRLSIFHKFALFFFSSSHLEEEKVKILGAVCQYSTRVI